MKLDNPVETRTVSSVGQKVFDTYRGSSLKEGPRPYIGASALGHHCDRYLWLNFRWAFFYQLPVEGRMELLFSRGDREEEAIVHNLKAIGLEPTYTLFNQLDIDYGCHVKGHPDGYLEKGIPWESNYPHNLEFKTHNDRSFQELVETGVEYAKPMHYAQMMLEMYGEKYIAKIGDVTRSLYYAVNKNNDDIYTERVKLDKEYAEKLIERGHDLALEMRIPEPDFAWDCGYCPFAAFCNKSVQIDAPTMYPEVNCRTCCHSTPMEDGSWRCELWDTTIPSLTAQHHACDAHCIHPDLVPGWHLEREKCTEWTACYNIPGIGEVYNGDEGETTTHIMRAVLKKENRSDEYLDRKWKIEAETLPDPNDTIPF